MFRNVNSMTFFFNNIDIFAHFFVVVIAKKIKKTLDGDSRNNAFNCSFPKFFLENDEYYWEDGLPAGNIQTILKEANWKLRSLSPQKRDQLCRGMLLSVQLKECRRKCTIDSLHGC